MEGTKFILRIDPQLLKVAKTGNEKAVLVAMLSFSDNGLGECWASHVKIGKVAGVSDKTVKKSIESTGVFGVVGKKKANGGLVNVYKVRSEYEPLLIKGTKVRSGSEVRGKGSEFEKQHLASRFGVEGYKTIKTRKKEEEEEEKTAKQPNSLSLSYKKKKDSQTPMSEKEKTNININRIFSFYKEKIFPPARIFDTGRANIQARLKEWSVEELLGAIDAFSKNNWWMKRHANNGVFWFFKTDDQVEKFINLTPEESPTEEAFPRYQ